MALCFVRDIESADELKLNSNNSLNEGKAKSLLHHRQHDLRYSKVFSQLKN